MAKKQKTAKPRSPDRALARATSRAQRFADRIDHLDEWIDRGARLRAGDRLDLPFRRDLCEAEYRRLLKLNGREGAPTLEDFARGSWRLDEQFRLEADVKLAANRLALLDGYVPSNRAPLDELLRRCFGRSDHPSPEEWHGKPDLEILRAVVAVLRELVDADGVARAVVKANRKPSPLEAAILDVLLDADSSLSGDELAPRVQRKRGKNTQGKAVLAAIGKLRSDCGFPGLFAGDAGFKLKPEERALAAKLLGK
jgi:hypothetical protein